MRGGAETRWPLSSLHGIFHLLLVFAGKLGSQYFTHVSSFISSHYHGVGAAVYPSVADVAQRHNYPGAKLNPK